MSNKNKKRALAICAHPDDMELRMGGTIIKMAKRGDEVKIISLASGNAGHYDMQPEALAERRKKEAEKAAKTAGLSAYEVWDVPDGYILPTQSLRDRLIESIRDFAPDIVFTFRVWDYHTDHRATAQLVQDASYLLTVPMIVPSSPIKEEAPIVMLTCDEFKQPCPFAPDIVVSIDDVVSDKLRMMACHESQFFEWLPFNRFSSDDIPEDSEERIEWLKINWLDRCARQADKSRGLLADRYGTRGDSVIYAETFEISEYGRLPRADELSEFFPM